MSEENKPEEEIVGLDDEVQEESKDKISILDYIKKFKLYIAISGGVVVIAVVALLLFAGGEPSETEPSVEAETHEVAVNHADIKNEQPAHTPENLNHEDKNIKAEYSANDSQPAEPKFKEPTLEEAVYEWTPEELMELARLKSMPKNEVPKDSTQDDSDIDTAAIMADLERIFAKPDVDESILNMTTQDSVDTMNWIEKEMAKLNKERKDIEKKRKQLEKMEYTVNQALTRIEQVESQRIVNLARLYDNMKAIEVAKLFMNLDDETVMQIIPRMKPGNASKILALLPPKRAARISSEMITVMEKK